MNGRGRRALAAMIATMLPAVAAAQDGRMVLEEITVVGQKVERSRADTASSVVVFDREAISERAGLDTLSDLLDRVPNLVTSETSNLAPAVRGMDGTGPAQGADAFFAGTRPRLNFRVDGRTLSYNEAIFSDATLWDIERVEVYRGPQSTLAGRNAIAGAIVVDTNDPTYKLEAGGRLLYGDEETRQISGVVSGPLIDDQLAYRLTADARRRDSYVEFTPYPGVDNPGRFESLALRGKLLIEPAALPDTSTLLTVTHMDAKAPQAAGVVRPFDEHIAAFPAMPRFATRATSVILDGTWETNEALTFTSILSATDLEIQRFARPGFGNAEIDGRELVAEPMLRFSLLDGRLDGFGGAHVFRAEQDEFIDLFGGGTFDDRTETDALFGEVTLAAAPRLDLTVGGRLEREERRREGAAGPFAIDFHETYEVFLPKLSLAWHARENLTFGLVVARGYNGGGAGFTFEPPFVSYTYDPEHVRNFELFSRASLYRGRLTLSTNVFYNAYDDLQLPFDLNPDPAVWSYVVRNADEAVTYGVELGSRLIAAPGLTLFADLGVIRTEVERYPGSAIEGNELPRTPAYALDVGMIYEHASGFEASLDARFSDAYFSTVENDPRGKTDPYWVANAEIAWVFPHMRVFATVTNLFDSVEPILLAPGTTRAGDVANLLAPRSVSAGIRFDL